MPPKEDGRLKLEEKSKGMFRVLSLAAAVASIAMMAAAAMMPWAALDGRTKVGPIPVSLDADLLEYGIDYKADLGNLSEAPLFSGVGSRIPSEMSGSKAFLTGLGEFQETIGFVKGTSKEKAIKVTSYTWPPPQNGTAEARITIYVKTIPWWPVGIAQDVGLKVQLVDASNISELKVQKVWFELQRTITRQKDGQTFNETLKMTAWEASPGDSLRKVGDERTYWGKVTVDDDYGEFSVAGYAQLELIDSYQQSNKKPGGGYFEINPGPKEVRLWTMSNEKTVRIAMMAAAFPMTVIAVVLVAAGAVSGLLGSGRDRLGRASWKLCLAGLILAILAVGFYVLGVNSLVELTGYSSWLSWKPLFFLAMGGACLPAVPAILLFIVRPPPAPRPKKDEKGGVKKGARKAADKVAEKKSDSDEAGKPGAADGSHQQT